MKMNRIILLTLGLSISLGLTARTFYKGEKVYINSDQSFHEFDWSADGAKLFMYLYNDGDTKNAWLNLWPVTPGSKIYEASFAAEGEYTMAVIVRKSDAGVAGDWENIWDQTCDIDIPDYPTCNCVYRFWKGNNCTGSADWLAYTPSIDEVIASIASVPEERIPVCPAAAGDPFSLHPQLVESDGKKEYNYRQVGGHTWLSSEDGKTWTSLDGYDAQIRTELTIDTFVTLPATMPANGVYYYLYSSIPAGRRLVHVQTDATNCELGCDITSFETAVSAVNADDNTYTLDGIVAFGKTNGALVIECDGKSVTITDPKSPQSFSLTKVPAAKEPGKKTVTRAYFDGDPSHCTREITIDIPSITESIIEIPVDVPLGQPATLTPRDAEPTNTYVWLVNGDTLRGAPQELALDTFRTDTTIIYTYKEYYPASGTMVDMMANGNYEDPSADYGTYGKQSKISEYKYWGYFPQTSTAQINFYTDTLPTGVNPDKLTSNGFAVVRNAYHFAPTYARVRAREGNNFALIDAVTGSEGGNKKAWYATTATNPNLKLRKGSTYVLSFWAANINNYGEMDNAAKFVFRIEYNGHTWESGELDLSKPEFRNNVWHQYSETFYADQECDDVTISVVNKNTNALAIGNDFALDDIQFHAISSVSLIVKSQQQFIVHAFEPCVEDRMYTKWEDVIFVVNPDNEYVAYQWYKNGNELAGETHQWYTDTTGMKGTTDTYYCRMTRADGSAVRTCEHRFDELPRSADKTPTTNSPQLIRRYRVCPHVYIIQTQVGDRIETKKIFTSYE